MVGPLTDQRSDANPTSLITGRPGADHDWILPETVPRGPPAVSLPVLSPSKLSNNPLSRVVMRRLFAETQGCDDVLIQFKNSS
jgi:hypothetical protein